MYQAVLVAPIGQACAPSNIWQRPGGEVTLGTQTCPALQPPPIVVVLQKRPLVAQVGVAATGVPLGVHTPFTVGVNGPATMPNTYDVIQAGVTQSMAVVSGTEGSAMLPAVQAPGLENAAIVVLHPVAGREHVHPEQLPGVRFCIAAIMSG